MSHWYCLAIFYIISFVKAFFFKAWLTKTYISRRDTT